MQGFLAAKALHGQIFRRARLFRHLNLGTALLWSLLRHRPFSVRTVRSIQIFPVGSIQICVTNLSQSFLETEKGLSGLGLRKCLEKK